MIEGRSRTTDVARPRWNRVRETGDFINLSDGYIADATAGPSQASLVTLVYSVLPASQKTNP